jgi:hypothetical protein
VSVHRHRLTVHHVRTTKRRHHLRVIHIVWLRVRCVMAVTVRLMIVAHVGEGVAANHGIVGCTHGRRDMWRSRKTIGRRRWCHVGPVCTAILVVRLCRVLVVSVMGVMTVGVREVLRWELVIIQLLQERGTSRTLHRLQHGCTVCVILPRRRNVNSRIVPWWAERVVIGERRRRWDTVCVEDRVESH